MSGEYFIAPNSNIVSNISVLSREQSVLEERRICELYEMVSDALNKVFKLSGDGIDVYELLSLLSDSTLINDGCIHTNCLSNNSLRLSNYQRVLSVIDKAVLCELIYSKLHELNRTVTEVDFLPRADMPETFVYVKNPLADEAYDVFSQDFNDPRIKYSENFKSAIRSVLDGDATYCLLPFEERGGSRLHTIDELIFKSDLKINSVTPVFGFDGSADMKYALVSKNVSVPPRRKEDDRYLEIRIPSCDGVSLGELLSVAEFYKMGVYRVSTVSFDTNDGILPYYSVVLRDDGQDFTVLLIYLTLFTSSYTPVGVYKNLE